MISYTDSIMRSPCLTKVVVSLVLLLPWVEALGIHRNLASLNRSSYDYIIVGGGLTGLVVANRLTEDGKTFVLVVEYGEFDDTWFTAIPYYANTGQAASLMFQPRTVPQPNLNGRSSTVGHGATVGGGSTVNGMAIVRGEKADYDLWEAMGNEGWGWKGILAYFRKSSTLNSPDDPKVSKNNYSMSPDGFGNGPYQASWPPWQWPDTANLTSAWINDMGLNFRVEGGLSGKNTGIVWKPIGMDGKNLTRCSARKAYYDPASKRPNLDILVTAFVSKINFHKQKAVGVHVIGSDNPSMTGNITATKEVILAAGAICTPQILQLSGIGPASLLRSLGIPVIQDLPGVGANLQDRARVANWRFRFNNSHPMNPASLQLANTSSPFFLASMAEYLANRTGPFTIVHGNNIISATLRQLTTSSSEAQSISRKLKSLNHNAYAPPFYLTSTTLLKGYDLQARLLTELIASDSPEASLFEVAYGSGDPRMGLTALKSFSRGTVHINTTLPHPRENPPLIDPHALAHPFDLTLALHGLKFGRRFINTSPILRRTVQPVELYPGVEVQSDEALKKLLVDEMYEPGNANQCCTAAMLPRELGGVVDARLRVHGVKGLRVVDASVLPVGPAGHLQSTMYAVGEKAAELIKRAELGDKDGAGNEAGLG